MATYEPFRLTQTGAQVQQDLNDMEALAPVTEESAGLMSVEDKQKLDGLPSGAELENSLGGKVDKVPGKGLSTNDYDDTEKAKVDSALQSETDPTVPAWAKQPNKPSYTAQEVGALPANTPIPTALSDLSEDTTHRVVTDVEKSNWNGKYAKPGTGIPKSDLADAVQASLGKADTAIQDLSPITDLIPAQASDQNQLADKEFVNSSIGTATATFRGTYNLVSDLSLTTSATREQVATALASEIATADNNDYAFVQIPTADATPSEIARVDRYKFDGTAWAYEWSLNNSSFTASQWAAINSGITADLVTAFGNKYDKPSGGIPSSDMASAVQTSLGKADTAYQKPTNGIPASDMEAGVIPDAVEANPTVPSGTTPSDLTGLKVGGNYYGLSGKENTSNKVTSLSSQSTDTQYPSAKCVYDLIGDVESLINAL